MTSNNSFTLADSQKGSITSGSLPLDGELWVRIAEGGHILTLFMNKEKAAALHAELGSLL